MVRLLLALLLFAAPGGSAAEPLPVRIELPLPAGVATAADAERVYKRDSVRAKLEPFAEGKAREVRSCAEYERARRTHSDDPTLEERCLALSLKRRLRPARESFVRAFTLDARSVRALPAILGFPVGEASYQKEAERAIENGTSFGSYFVTLSDRLTLTVEKAKTRRLSFRTGGGEPDLYQLDVAGRGDWNGDGLDDLVLRTYHAYLRNASESCVLVLTRKSQSDRFRIVDGRCHLSDNHGSDAPKPIERRFVTLDADLGCSGDAADEERAAFDRRYRTPGLAEGYATLLRFHDRCRSKLAAPQRVRLVGTLLLGAHKLKRRDDCRRLARERSANEVYASNRSRKALEHNLKLCLPGETIKPAEAP
jgi:hypothetical protein